MADTNEDKTESESNEASQEPKGWIRRFWKWLREFIGLEETEPFWRTRVSHHHHYEAKERYRTLCTFIDNYKTFYKSESRIEINVDLPEECIKVIRKQMKTTADETLSYCDDKLKEAKKFISRKQGDLNNLWRTMTRLRIMLTENVIPDSHLGTQYYFCREEAKRLGVTDDPEVRDLIEALASSMDEKGENHGPKFRQLLRALLERFNTIRTGRLHQQFVNVKVYNYSLVVLLFVSLPLLMNEDLFIRDVVKKCNDINTKRAVKLECTKISGTPSQAVNEKPESIADWVKFRLYHEFRENILFFVFFSGLLGGFFSVTMRNRSDKQIPGEDVYLSTYMLTKPFIGAMGAVFMYLLVMGGLVTTEMIRDDIYILLQPGARTFGFAFISAFTERLVFPGFK